MKILLTTLLFASSAMFAQEATPAATSTTATSTATNVPAQTTADPYAAKARSLVEQMIATLGGQPYLTYQTRTEDGRTYSFYQGQSRGSGTLYWRMWKYPDKDRTEVTKQRDISYLVVGDKGYEITYKGTAPQEPEALADYLRRRDHSLEIVTREWLKDPATVILPSGTGIAEQKLCDLVTIINPRNDSVTIAIDQLTHLPVQKTFTYRDKDRYKVEESEVYANYRVQQGIQTPFTWTRKKDGLMVTQRFINNVEYNAAIPEEKFEAKGGYEPLKK